MSSRLIQNLFVKVNFTPRLSGRDLEAEFSIIDEDVVGSPRAFELSLLPNFSTRKSLILLAHEMVHIKQYATGELREYIRYPNILKYRKQYFNIDETYNNDDEYYDSPWEIEAYGREYGLYVRFLRSLA